MNVDNLDFLFFGAHPDDVEIGAGGTVAVHAAAGYRCGIVDLTRGEMSSNGTPQQRAREGEKAASILGAIFRESLGLPDAKLEVTNESMIKVVEVIRKYRPQVIVAPNFPDRHPDHEEAGKLIRQACYKSGLKKIQAQGEPYRPQAIYYYFLGKTPEPDILVDISDVYDIKWKSIAAHESQFDLPGEGQVATSLNTPLFVQYVRSRDQFHGSLAGTSYAEGLMVENKIVVKNLFSLEGGRR